MKTSNEINEISKAMSMAQGEMRPASKSTVNPFFKSKYSTLAQIWEAAREPMTKNNLTIMQNVSSCEQGISISTRICHASGQWIEFGPLEIPLNKRDAQSVGSATSYGKRYSLSAAIGVVSEEEDDDAESAMGRKDEKKDTKMNQNKVDTKKDQPTDEKRFVNKDQIREFNQNYDKCDDVFRKFIDDTIFSLSLKDLSNMEEKVWKKFMLTFQKHFDENKKVG